MKISVLEEQAPKQSNKDVEFNNLSEIILKAICVSVLKILKSKIDLNLHLDAVLFLQLLSGIYYITVEGSKYCASPNSTLDDFAPENDMSHGRVNPLYTSSSCKMLPKFLPQNIIPFYFGVRLCTRKARKNTQYLI